MKRFMAVFVILVLTVCTCFASCDAETLVTYGGQFPETKTGYNDFLQENPNIHMEWSDVIYNPPTLLTTALISGEFDCDLFTEGTNAINWETLMKKGYCLDLSGSSVLMKAVQRMHPQIAAEAFYEGRLYTIPIRINFQYWEICKGTWNSLGYTQSDFFSCFYLICRCNRSIFRPHDCKR